MGLFKKNIFGQYLFIKKWIIRIIGSLSHRRYHGYNELQIEGSDIYFNIDLDNHIFLTKGQSLNFTINNKGNQNTGNKFQVDSTNDNEVLDGASLQSGTLNKLIQIGLKNPIDKRNTAVINGVIKNKKNGEPVFGASIFIDNPKIGVVSDQYGSFVIDLPKGKNILHVQSLGMRDMKQPIQLNGDGKIIIDLTESVTSLKKLRLFKLFIDLFSKSSLKGSPSTISN